jgi:2-polyprenyl-3-methyl-5-hydroxy-6-metoxy-1,4-benzoquinol methylase
VSFPWHDPPWCEVGDLLEAAADPSERVLAPDQFWWRFPSLWRYVPANLDADADVDYDWIVVHKGEVPAIPRPFLEHVVATTTPVLANEVFVVFAARPGDRTVAPGSPHLLSFLRALAQLPPEPQVELAAISDRVLEVSPTLRAFGALSPAEARAAQDDFFLRGGYRYPTLRDQAYFDEVRSHVQRVLRPHTRVLDVASGAFPAPPLPPGVTLVRTDFSPVGTAQAVARDVDRPNVSHVVCDGAVLSVRSGEFDTVLFVDSIEHVSDAGAVMAECSRAARIGGEVLVSFSNTNSLNQVLARALGYPVFVTNHQHLHEFTPEDVYALLDGCGLDVVDTAGIELRPYWGVPGLDDVVRETLDEDPELVGMLAELGRRAGIDYAYVGVVKARKRG